MERRLVGTDEIRHALSQQRFPISSFVQVAVLTCRTRSHATHSEILSELQQLFPETNITIFRNEILLLLSYPERHFDLQLPHEKEVNALLERFDAFLTLSNGTRNLNSMPVLYGLVRQTAVLAQQLNPNPKQRIFTVDEYSVYCIIDLCAKRFIEMHRSDDIIYLVHPAVIHLTRYDRKHNTNLRTVLFYYLRNDRNLIKTATDTYMHRNTVINKVNKILELVDIDLEDGSLRERLMFSCQIILYYEKVMHLELKL